MGKLVSEIGVKWEGDLFRLFQFPYQLSDITPHLIQSVDLLSGTWGTVGSVIRWTYTQDGVKSTSKEMIEAIDEQKKSITFKVMEGDPIKSYKSFKIITEVESNGADNVLTWSLEYEKQNGGVPHPTAFMDSLLVFSKEVERSRQLVPN